MVSRSGWVMCLGLAACGGVVGEGDGVVDEGEIPGPGWTAEFITNAHDTSGTAVIVDEDTIEIRDWVYDGGGINARLFLLVDGAPFFRDFELTDNLVGSPSDGETLVLDIPGDAEPGTWDAISLWCIPAGADFGTGTFQPPADEDDIGA